MRFRIPLASLPRRYRPSRVTIGRSHSTAGNAGAEQHGVGRFYTPFRKVGKFWLGPPWLEAASEVWQPHQLLGVAGPRPHRLQALSRKVVIDGGQPAGLGMAPARDLNRRKPQAC